MTRKDYEKIAIAMQNAKPLEGSDDYDVMLDCWQNTLWYLSEQFELNNPRFARAKFLKACGLED